jgi:Metallo-beta-lactamase superfamily
VSTEADLASAARRPIDWRPVEIRPGLWSIPIASLQAVNVYVLELAGGGLALVDAGWDSEGPWTAPVTGVPDGAMLDLPGWSVRAVWTPGHTQGHLCLYDTGHRLLFSGDHVLPRITPGVGVHPAEESDVLGDFLASL